MKLTQEDIAREMHEIKQEIGIEVEEKTHSSHLNKFIIPTISVLLLLLISFYSVFGPVNTNIKGQIESSTLKNNQLLIGNYTLLFKGSSGTVLQEAYYSNQLEREVETSVCLLGTIQNNTYTITELHFPKIFSQSFNQVSFSPCPDDAIIMLHTHPYKSCLASEQDIYTLKKHQKTNPHLLMLVMCEEQRYNLYD